MSVALQLAPTRTDPSAPGRPGAWPAARPRAVQAPEGRRSVDARVLVLHVPADPPLARPVRLSRRGVAALAGLVLAVCVGLVWLAAASAPTATPTPAAPPATVSVRTGDTLWSIAGQVAPGRDPRAEVELLRQLNHLGDGALMPGQVLRTR